LLVDQLDRPLVGEQHIDDPIARGRVARPDAEDDASRRESVTEIARERPRRLRSVEDALPDAGPARENGEPRSRARVDPDDQISLRVPELERLFYRRAERSSIAVLGDDQDMGMRYLAGLVRRRQHDRDARRDPLPREQAYGGQPALSQETR
jgi:hypothetical protein